MTHPISFHRASARALMVLAVLAVWPTWLCAFGLSRGGRAEEVHRLVANGNRLLRVEVRSMQGFEVVKTGDKRGAGELRSIWLYLQGNDEYNSQGAKGGSAFARVQRNGQRIHEPGHSNYIGIRKQDWVQVSAWNARKDGRNGEPLWIHVRPGGTFTLEAKFRELDCTKHRNCRRHNDGHYTLRMTLPEFPRRLPSGCGDENTYHLATIDGRVLFRGLLDQQVQVSGKLRMKPVWGQLCVTETTR